MKNNFKDLIFYILITLIVGSFPSIFVYSNNFYDYINKPIFSPPGFIFPIVWFILFALMGISIYLVTRKSSDKKYIKVYFLQLLVNTLWTPLFFGFKSFFLSLICLFILIVLVIKMIYLFYKENKLSSYLNIPYLVWLLFAFYLNFSILILNS